MGADRAGAGGADVSLASNANGQNRERAAWILAGALLTAVATKLGEWAVEEVRRRVKDKSEKKEGLP